MREGMAEGMASRTGPWPWAICCAVAWLVAGSGCGSAGAPARQQPSYGDIRAIVRDELRSDPTLRSELGVAASAPPDLAKALQSPAGQKALQDALMRVLEAPEAQKGLEEAMAHLISSPAVQKSLQEQVRSALMKMASGGGAGGGGGGGGGAGGGMSGGGGGGGGAGGGS